MDEHRKKVLNLLSEGKISVDDAERLLAAMGLKNEPVEDGKNVVSYKSKPKPRFLRVIINDKGSEYVDIKVPLGLIRAGVKLGSMMPEDTGKQLTTKLRGQGIDFDLENLNAENIETLIEQLSELQVNIDGGQDGKVHIFCE